MYEYYEFRLRISPTESNVYQILASGPSGDISGHFRLSFSDLEIENFVLRVGRARQGVRRIESPEMTMAKRFGAQLFDALFQDRVRDIYRASLTSARKENKGLRITLNLTDTPELMDHPWEYLYDDPDFLSISVWTPVVRYLDLPRIRRPMKVIAPLRILGMVSSPIDAVPLDKEQEQQKLEQALSNLIRRQMVEIHWLEQGTLRALQKALRRQKFHIFHFIGHGVYDTQEQDGFILLAESDGRGRPLSGARLGTILQDHFSLRLAVLNACEGARTGRSDPFAGVAVSLIQRGVPAVIAMQFEITDRAAAIFAEEFYAALADGFPVDAALAEARKAIFADNNDIEWGTPVLFLRVADGRVFDMLPQGQSSPEEQSVTISEIEPKLTADGLEPEDALGFAARGETSRQMKRYEEALADFNRALELDPDYVWALARRGEIHRLMKRYEEALADLNRAIELDVDYAWAWAVRGHTYQSMECYGEALADFNRALELDPDYVWALAQRGEIHRLMKRYEEALADLNRALELDPDYVWALAQRGEIHQLTKRFGEALTDFNRALELDPDYVWALAQRGEIYCQMKRYREALADFNRALELNPDYVWVLAHRGEIHRLMKHYEEALADFDRALELNPDYVWVISQRGKVHKAAGHNSVG